MTRRETSLETEPSAWSAHNLPAPQAPRMLRFSVLAVAAGLIVIVLATAVKDPIRTSGTQMEPTRFKTAVQQQAVPGTVVMADMK